MTKVLRRTTPCAVLNRTGQMIFLRGLREADPASSFFTMSSHQPGKQPPNPRDAPSAFST